jgi:hypothetical protein
MTAIFYAGQTDYINQLNVVSSEFSVTSVAAVAAGTTVLDCSLGSRFLVTMGTGNTTLSFTNVPSLLSNRITVLINQGTTGTKTVTWPASVVWPAATVPTLTVTANRVDIIELTTINSGTKFYGRVYGLNYV